MKKTGSGAGSGQSQSPRRRPGHGGSITTGDPRVARTTATRAARQRRLRIYAAANVKRKGNEDARDTNGAAPSELRAGAWGKRVDGVGALHPQNAPARQCSAPPSRTDAIAAPTCCGATQFLSITLKDVAVSRAPRRGNAPADGDSSRAATMSNATTRHGSGTRQSASNRARLGGVSFGRALNASEARQIAGSTGGPRPTEHRDIDPYNTDRDAVRTCSE